METKKSEIFRILMLLIIILIIGTAAFVLNKQTNSGSGTEKAETGNKLYVCSMHPQVIQDKPGDCPICGMFLIEKIDKDINSADENLNDVIRPVNESVLASVQTVKAISEEIPLSIEASGILNFDTRNVSTVSARFGGIIEKSFVRYAFQPIRKGQKIFEIYCPDIYTDKWYYVQFLQAYPDQDAQTAEAREWLRLLGLSKGQVDSLRKAPKPDYHLAVYSDVEGYAVSNDFDPEKYFVSPEGGENASQTLASGISLNEGVKVVAGTPLFKVINTNTMRADLRVRTEDAIFLNRGQKVILSDAVSPGAIFEATISQIEPFNQGFFQLVKVFIDNKKGELTPGRQIQAEIKVANHNALWLPKTAIANLGRHKSVFLMQGGTFVAKEIKTGTTMGNKIEVVSGIDPDSEVVLNASLLTDSDSFIETILTSEVN